MRLMQSDSLHHTMRMLARDHDYERYLCSLFAPAPYQSDLWALLALGHELLKIPENVSDAMVGLVRLKWWQEQLEAVSHGKDAPDNIAVLQAMQPLLQAQIIPQATYEMFFNVLADSMGEGVSHTCIAQTMQAFYAMLAYGAHQPEQVQAYEQTGHISGTLATVHMLLRQGDDVNEAMGMLDMCDMSGEAIQNDRFLHQLRYVNHTRMEQWRKRKNIGQIHLLPLRLVWNALL